MKLRIQLISSTIFFVLGVSFLCQAQKISVNNLAATTREADTDNSNCTENTSIKSLFMNLFPQATAQQWNENASNSFVYFLNNGRRASACFSANGKLNYAITACDMGQLPKGLRKKIGTNYKTYSLFHATQIMAYGETVYQAILENETGFITLKYGSDGMEEVLQVKK